MRLLINRTLLYFRFTLTDFETDSDVIFLVGAEPDVQRIPAHTWILAKGSPVFRAMFKGPFSQQQQVGVASVQGPPTSTSKVGTEGNVKAGKRKTATVAVSDVDGRAFDILLR